MNETYAKRGKKFVKLDGYPPVHGYSIHPSLEWYLGERPFFQEKLTLCLSESLPSALPLTCSSLSARCILGISVTIVRPR